MCTKKKTKKLVGRFWWWWCNNMSGGQIVKTVNRQNGKSSKINRQNSKSSKKIVKIWRFTILFFDDLPIFWVSKSSKFDDLPQHFFTIYHKIFDDLLYFFRKSSNFDNLPNLFIDNLHALKRKQVVKSGSSVHL